MQLWIAKQAVSSRKVHECGGEVDAPLPEMSIPSALLSWSSLGKWPSTTLKLSIVSLCPPPSVPGFAPCSVAARRTPRRKRPAKMSWYVPNWVTTLRARTAVQRELVRVVEGGDARRNGLVGEEEEDRDVAGRGEREVDGGRARGRVVGGGHGRVEWVR